MDFDKSFATTLVKLDQVRLVLQQLKQGEAVSSLDLDLAKANMIQVYEQLLTIKDPAPAAATPGMTREVKKVAEPIVKPKREKPAAPPLDPVIILSDTAAEDTLTIEAETKPEKPVITEAEKKAQGKMPEIVAEKFQDNKKVMNEALTDRSRKSQKDLSSVLQNKPIQSIESAIGINDKFLFIKELFNGNAPQYKETLDLLNNTTDFNTAVQYVEQRFNWDMESEAVIKLLDLLRRRYISHSNG